MARKTDTAPAAVETVAPADDFPTVIKADEFARPSTRKPAAVDPRFTALAEQILADGSAYLSLAGKTPEEVKSFNRKLGAAIKAAAPGKRVTRLLGTANGEPAVKVMVQTDAA